MAATDGAYTLIISKSYPLRFGLSPPARCRAESQPKKAETDTCLAPRFSLYLHTHQQKHYDMSELRKIPNVGETTEQDLMAIFDNIGAYKEELESLLTFKFRLCNS